MNKIYSLSTTSPLVSFLFFTFESFQWTDTGVVGLIGHRVVDLVVWVPRQDLESVITHHLATVVPRAKAGVRKHAAAFMNNVLVRNNTHMSHLVGKPTMWFPKRSDTNRSLQSQKIEILNLKSRGIVLSDAPLFCTLLSGFCSCIHFLLCT